MITTLAQRIESRTPADRDRAVDGLRALALLGVVAGHWMVGALVLTGGGLVVDSPLRALPALGPASWVLQMLGLFFLVGGRVAAQGWASARSRGRRYVSWLWRRVARLCRPVLAVLVAWTFAVPALLGLGVSGQTVRSAVTLVLQPLWFVAVYLVLTALTRLVMAADQRFGLLALVPGPVIVAVVDALRYGPWSDQVPGWIQWLNLLPGWLFGYQLGVAWAAGRFAGRRPWLLLGVGVAAFTTLVTVAGYPLSMVGVPGSGRTNAHPPSLLVLALAAVQSGVALLVHRRLSRTLHRPRLWAAVVVVNLAAMSILCWHQTAALVPAMVADSRGLVLPGLTDAPTGAAWLATRAAWLPLLLALLVGFCWAARRWESGDARLAPTRTARRHPGAGPLPSDAAVHDCQGLAPQSSRGNLRKRRPGPLLGADARLVLPVLRGPYRGTDGGMGVHQRGRPHPGRGADGLGQDAVGVPLGAGCPGHHTCAGRA